MKEELDEKKELLHTVEMLKNGLDVEKKFTKSQLKIIQAATELFSTKGFENSSTIDIAKQAGVAEITIFRNFKSKNNLLFQLLAPVIANISKPTQIDESKYLLPEELIKDVVLERIRAFEEYDVEMNILIKESINHSEVREAVQHFISGPTKKAISSFLEDKMEKEYFRPVNNQAVVDLLYFSILGFVMNHYVLRVQPFSDNHEEAITTYLDFLLKGIYNKK
ncbi:hypothetical protein AJ85_19885 [Alkalihalobacillus alcalophilus ATCC 27647 = CGMCC 1.3604]|uniref:HTH tetR-type domain-containing protein n=1 Tax=Alkalihalobacillus alcalophilus ATCC 27647 = CGMCC 1.3604 TaxID=1218173 RepID=A0A094YT87_ALKAL|nr:TetR/AcrR family transcriptional regulator [Alkalihalobacillus alcalophilus]KGA96677.1 hypothetical protein BALCAV_0214690 [Alkalihalobacillus alcalophilus ATCC 27647 = CGMCC 1.3604]MED1562392.1 helix-turn-helix domain containing protein [Alkalihalobacillus alcalophilus]THG89046.1 hypothetical protein AJ85_19885 [Alkalihalobacillus alcalophilus ATCC 27647 = CGMCC 1.3604]